ncbi:MAG: high-potential iron-sulfur protein [Halieaceae bacterium]|nr:high-potential iron-sulfur protein [Halieaceae bacterium]
MSNSKKFTRRDVLAASGALIATSLVARPSFAADKVTEDDPTAVALGYLHDATKVDTAKWAKRAGDAGAKQFCNNCALYVDQGDGWGACSIFQGRLVAGGGWCNAWIAK